MVRTYLTKEDRAWQWQTLSDSKPCALLGRHPAGSHVAMQVSAPLPQASHVHVERAGVWDVRTRALVWAPEGTNALTWLPAGDRIIGVGESHEAPADVRQRITRTPYQSDFSYHGRYFGENSNLIEGPVFSPDGTFAVASPGGELLAGTIAIANPVIQTFEERDVLCYVERGWLPDNPEDIRAEMLSLPTFISNRAFTVTAANGQTITFNITA